MLALERRHRSQGSALG